MAWDEGHVSSLANQWRRTCEHPSRAVGNTTAWNLSHCSWWCFGWVANLGRSYQDEQPQPVYASLYALHCRQAVYMACCLIPAIILGIPMLEDFRVLGSVTKNWDLHWCQRKSSVLTMEYARFCYDFRGLQLRVSWRFPIKLWDMFCLICVAAMKVTC